LIYTLAYKYNQRHFIRVICAASIATPFLETCFGQSGALSLASIAKAPGGTETVPISLAAPGDQPAALQWMLNYAASDSSITAAAGPVATAFLQDHKLSSTAIKETTICHTF